MSYSILSHIDDVAQKVVGLIDDNSVVETSKQPVYNLVRLSAEPCSYLKDQLKAALGHTVAYAFHQDKLYYFDRNLTAHRVFFKKNDLLQLQELFPEELDKPEIASSEEQRNVISTLTRCNLVIAACIKAYERYINETSYLARVVASYMGESIASSIGLVTRDDKFEALISSLCDNKNINYSKLIQEFTNTGGWENNSANTLLLFELIYSTYPGGIEETEADLFQHGIVSKTLKKNFFKHLEATIASIDAKEAQKKIEDPKPIDVSHIALFFSVEDAKEHQKNNPHIQTITLMEIPNEKDGPLVWQLSWYDALGNANYLPITPSLKRRFSAITDSVQHDIKVYCSDLLKAYPYSYFFENDEEAKTFIENHPEENCFLITFLNEKWQIFYYDIEGNQHAIEIPDELKSLLKKQLDPELKKPKLNTSLIPCSTTREHYDLKLQCLAFLNNRLDKTAIFIDNPPPLLESKITSWFVLKNADPREIQLHTISGNRKVIPVEKGTRLAAWLEGKEFNEDDLLLLKNILTRFDCHAEVNPETKKTIHKLLMKQPELSLFIADNLETVTKWNRQIGGCFLIGKKDHNEIKWELYFRSRNNTISLIDISTPEWAHFRDILSNHPALTLSLLSKNKIEDQEKEIKKRLFDCINHIMMKTQLLATNDLSSISEEQWDNNVLGDRYILLRESIENDWVLYQRNNEKNDVVDTSQWKLFNETLAGYGDLIPENFDLSMLTALRKAVEFENSKKSSSVIDEVKPQNFEANKQALSSFFQGTKRIRLVLINELSLLKSHQLIPGTYYLTKEKQLYQRMNDQMDLIDTSRWLEVHRLLAEIDVPLESLAEDTINTIRQAIDDEASPKKAILTDQKSFAKLDPEAYKDIRNLLSGNATSSSSSSMDLFVDNNVINSFSPLPPLPGALSFFNGLKKNQSIPPIIVKEVPVTPEIESETDIRYGVWQGKRM